MKIFIYTFLAVICTWTERSLMLFGFLVGFVFFIKGIYWICKGISKSYGKEV